MHGAGYLIGVLFSLGLIGWLMTELGKVNIGTPVERDDPESGDEEARRRVRK